MSNQLSSNQILTEISVDLDNRDKNTTLIRLILVFPMLVFIESFSLFANGATGVVGGVLLLPTVLALLVRNKYPSYVLAFNKAFLELSNRVAIYALLLTDAYPSIESNQKVRLIYPDIDGGNKLNRFLPLIKWLLAIPLYIVGIIYSIYALILTFLAWINILRSGSYPEQRAEEVVKVIAFWNRVYGYAILLVSDEYPSFSLK
jgi:hypothetical protein